MGRSLQAASIILLLLCSGIVLGASSESDEAHVSVDSIAISGGGDSLTQSIKLDMSYYLNDFKGDVEYSLQKQFKRSQLSQKFTYSVDYNRQTLNRQQQITLDGTALWGSNTKFGFEWLPLLYENDYVDRDSGYGVVAMSLGPVVQGALWEVPMAVSGGYTFDVWNENIARDWLETSMESTTFDDGAYFKVKAGSPLNPLIPRANLYSHGQVSGRYMRGLANSKVTRGDVYVAYKRSSLFGTDSLSLSFIDTLIHGRVETPYEHKSSYLENSVRVDNLSSIILDMASIGTGYIEPTVSVVLTQNQYRYPFSDNNSSRQDREFSTRLSYEKEVSPRFSLAGELGVVVGSENHLYEKSNQEILDSDDIGDKTGNLDDAELFKPLFGHSLIYTGSKFLSIDYRFYVERDKKRYPFYYTSFSDTVRSSSDYDKQHMSHVAKIGFAVTSKLMLTVIGDYNRELSYYLSPRASRNSFSRDRYKVELGQRYSFDSTSFFATAIGSYVEPKEFLYKQSIHSRNFYGRVNGTQAFSPRLKLLYNIEGRLYDRGDWFGSGGYGISRKSREVRTDLTSGFFILPPMPGRKHVMAWQVTGGFEGAFERTQNWLFTDERFNKGTNLYKVAPTGGLTLLLNKGFTIKAQMKRYFDHVKDIELYEAEKSSGLPGEKRYTGDLQKYWDLTLSVTYGG